MQQIMYGNGCHKNLNKILNQVGAKKVLLVHGDSFEHLPYHQDIENMPVSFVRFSKFRKNPLMEDVYAGLDCYNKEQCNTIVAVGGGSAIDVAKCIKLFSNLNSSIINLDQEFIDSKIPLIVIPTTAGSGSESTRFAVIYYKGEKQSITQNSILPDYVLLEPSALLTLSSYQKKCTLLDALCQGIESWWSINASDESKEYSKGAIELIVENWREYINVNTLSASNKIMRAANLAGRAINIAQTTAAHAMSYKLTSMYGIPHGHAVAVCLLEIWKKMIFNMNNCVVKREKEYLVTTFMQISQALRCECVEAAVNEFGNMLNELRIFKPETGHKKDIAILTNSVNAVRLKNNPMQFSKDEIEMMYRNILNIQED